MTARPAPAPLLAVAAAGATLATLTSWSGLSEASGSFLWPLTWLVLGSVATGVVLRAARMPRVLVVLGQLAVAFLLVNHRSAAAESHLGWVPTGGSVRALAETVGAGAAAATEWAAPVPASVTEFAPLLIVAGLGVALVVDVLASTLRLPALAGLPLLAAFTAPLGIVDGAPWSAFVLAAVCFVVMLAADQAHRLSGWGRAVASGPRPAGSPAEEHHRVGFGALLPGAARVGAVGVLGAVLVPMLLPQPDGLVDRGGGGGGGSGSSGVTLSNPLVDIRRDLTQGPDVPVVLVETEQTSPAYLRTTVLDKFDGSVWEPAERSIPAAQRANGELPQPPGLGGATPRRPVDSTFVTTEDFRSLWLPVPYPATRLQVDGDWRFDLDTLDFLTTEGGDAATSLQYAATTLEVAPTAEQLVGAPAPPRSISREGTALPDSMPSWIAELTESVVADSGSDFERAVRLQQWFREDGGFVYSLERGSGSGLEQLELFLGTGPGSRTGYCEQFASAMAMMARTLGIPARVAVGFLRPDPVGPRRWVYSSRDLHSWPELYFEGAGWIRFEPTPQQRAVGVPAYTSGQVPRPQTQPSPTASASPSAPAPERSPAPGVETEVEAETDGAGGAGWWWLLPVALLALLAVAPQAWRSAQARRRRESGSAARRVHGAWAEVRATAFDLGLRWDDTVTLRQQARALAPSLGGSVGGVRALRALALLVERARYSGRPPSETDAEEATRQMVVVTDALRGAASTGARRRARLLPASLWHGGREGPEPEGGETSSSPTEAEKVLL